MPIITWSDYFLSIAEAVRQKSKDPNTKVGAVIVGPDHQIISTGFNGFPRGIDETIAARWDVPLKYDFIEHAERNAIYNAARHGISLKGCSMYLSTFAVPCIACSKAVIQSGIVTVVGTAREPTPDHWVDNLKFAELMLREAGVECRSYT